MTRSLVLPLLGIGPVFCAGILAEIGDIERFSDQASLAKYAGLSWKKHQSGSFRAEETNMIRSGNRYLRYYLVEAANSVQRNEADYRAYYQKKYSEVPKHQHQRALVLTHTPALLDIRRMKYLNNLMEQDHRFIQKLVRPMIGFQSFRTAIQTLKGIEAMHMIKKGQIASLGTSVSEKVNFIHNLFKLVA